VQREYGVGMAESDEIPAVETLPPVRRRQASGARRARWPFALALVWALLAVADIVIFHPSLSSSPAAAAKQAVTPSAAGHAQTATGPAHRRSAARARGAGARARVLVPVSASAFGPAGSGSGDNPQLAPMVIEANAAAPWVTDWYRSAQFGGLQAGTGLLISMGRPVRITSVRIILGSERGADLELLTGNIPVRARMRLAGSASHAGGRLRLKLARPRRARYLLIWFTLLPPDSAGTFQASVYNVRVEGRR
jgi:hypothetical protein